MSELLRPEERQHEVHEHRDAHEQTNGVVDSHTSPHFISRSHAATYPMLTTKKRIVTATKITSSTAACLSQSRIRGPSFPEGHVHVELHGPQHVFCSRL